VTARTRGRFITLEGVDGAGKSSHVATIRGILEAHGIDAVITREPGGTELGEQLRALLLREKMGLRAETLLIFAARAEHIERVIAPALEAGVYVVSDRFTDATYAYQGGARGLDRERIQRLESWVQEGLQPDLTLLFDVPVEIAVARRQQASLALDRFEQEDRRFFEKVRQAYLQRVRESPHRIRVIDAAGTPDEVKSAVERTVMDFLKLN